MHKAFGKSVKFGQINIPNNRRIILTNLQITQFLIPYPVAFGRLSLNGMNCKIAESYFDERILLNTNEISSRFWNKFSLTQRFLCAWLPMQIF